MKAAGVIVEYNPYHNGHLHHIQQTKIQSKADVIVAIMSGNFLQRGEPALVSKWTRTKMALEGGADLVIELPYVFATQKATTFAHGSISLMDALFVNEICFGSENGDIQEFETALNTIELRREEYENEIKKAVKDGISYPKATSRAFQIITKDKNIVDLSQPNNILGFQYLVAINNINNKIKARTIKRTGAHYHDETFHSNIASATSIRKTLFNGNAKIDDISSVIPEATFRHLKNYQQHYKLFHQWEYYFPFLKYRLLTMSAKELQDIYEAEEGLENRLLEQIKYSESFEDFMEAIKTKRYTWTRLQRFCLHILMNIRKEEMKKTMTSPSYIRLLGMTTTGQKYIKEIKKSLPLPLVPTLSGYRDEQLSIDLRSVYTYATIFPEPLRSKFIKQEFSTPPIRYDREQQLYLS